MLESDANSPPPQRLCVRPWLAPATERILGCVVGGFLILAAISKAAEPQTTLTSLRFVFGPTCAALFSPLLVGVEIVIGAALVSGAARQMMWAAATSLFGVFCVWTASLNISRAPVDCGCGPAVHSLWAFNVTPGARRFTPSRDPDLPAPTAAAALRR